MAIPRVDFKALKSEISFSAILSHLNIALKGSGDQLQGLCPLPTHPIREARKRTPSFSANLAKKNWQCFGCGAHGNHIEFYLRMQGLNPDDGADFKKGAAELQRIFFSTAITGTPPSTSSTGASINKEEPKAQAPTCRVQTWSATIILAG